MLMPSRKFLEARTRAWVELLKAELPPALERDVIRIAAKAVRGQRRPRAAKS
ncbi:hypothetical protein PUN4_570143 [Paraburkholderia unamae]|jgi:hypothetical protein|nr:hypothetical protein PUN4_570143 [Paraburkholderia unamae]